MGKRKVKAKKRENGTGAGRKWYKRKRNINGEKKIINERERKWKEMGKWKGKYSKQRKLSEYGKKSERKWNGMNRKKIILKGRFFFY